MVRSSKTMTDPQLQTRTRQACPCDGRGVAASIPARRDWAWQPLLSSLAPHPSSILPPPTNCPHCPSCRLARKSKTFFYETNPNLLGTQRPQILFLQRLTRAQSHFRYQENEPKRTQTAQTKKLFLRNEPKPSWWTRITNPFIAKAYEGKAAFSLSRKRTQTNPNSCPAGGSTPGYTDFVAVWGLANGGIW
jgi:hypothetical protein